MSYTQAFIKDSLKRIEAKLDDLLRVEKENTLADKSIPEMIKESQQMIESGLPKAQSMTAAERMAHARSFKKDVNTGEEGRG